MKITLEPVEWLHCMMTNDITVSECENILKRAKEMHEEQQIKFLEWLRVECSNRSDGWRHIMSDDNTIYTDIGIYEKYKNRYDKI